MKNSSWNTRGLENPWDILALHDLIKKEALDIVFLQEIRLQTRTMENCMFKLGFKDCLIIDSIGKSGEITLLWNLDVDVSIIYHSKNHIYATISDRNHTVGDWLFIFIYDNL